MRIEKVYQNLIEEGGFKGDFKASKINGSHFRVGIDKENNPTILIDESSSETGVSSQAYKLKHIEIRPNVSCDVFDADNGDDLKEYFFTTIKLVNFNSHLLSYFFLLIEHIIDKLTNEDYETSVKIEVERLVDLFSKSGKVDFKTALGLWGELFFIEKSEDVNSKVKDWHVDAKNALDFSHGGNCYSEVKTTVGSKREHNLSLKQLKRYSESSVTIASIMTEKSSNGKSIQDLIDDILDRLTGSELRDKLITIVSDTLDGDTEIMKGMVLDYDYALSTYKEYDMTNFPRLEFTLPKFITDAKFTVNFDVLP